MGWAIVGIQLKIPEISWKELDLSSESLSLNTQGCNFTDTEAPPRSTSVEKWNGHPIYQALLGHNSSKTTEIVRILEPRSGEDDQALKLT